MAIGFQVRIGARWTTAPRRRRAWIGADGLTWTARNGIVRWCWRTSDTKRNHNSTRYGREGFTYAGKDCNAGLVASSKIGGETSLRARMDAGVVITAIKPEDLPPALLEDESDHGLAMARVQRYEAKILFPCGPAGEE